MENPKFEIKSLDADAVLPKRAHSGDAGLDLSTTSAKTLEPGEGFMFSTGIAMAVPQGAVGMIADRSSLGKKGIKTFGGIIDAGYRGEVKVLLRNLSMEVIRIEKGDRIAQLLLLPILTPEVTVVSALSNTERAEGGFGSSGR